VRLAIDDFGTGYSSLAYLKRFPVDVVKVDRSFVRDVPHDADDAAIVKGIIALAHSLRLEVVAEGVETEAQLEFLRAQACDMLQGYYLSMPVPADQFARYLAIAAKHDVERHPHEELRSEASKR
jgi:EAL domain-containing protein (putative c-di-GMP-specific phosphodiesterase class I)